MSVEITYDDATAQVANLQPGQVAFQITSGTFSGALVRVQILRTADEDLDGDGTPDQLNLKVSGAVIDASNNVQQTSGGKPMEVPGKVASMLLAALAEGTEDLAVFQADQARACVYRMINLATALQAFETIPGSSG